MIHTANHLSATPHTQDTRPLWAAYLAASFAAQDYEQTHPTEQRTPAEQQQLSELQAKADKADQLYSYWFHAAG